MASVCRGVIVTLTLIMFVCGTLSSIIPPDLTATQNGTAQTVVFYGQCGQSSSQEVSYFQSADEFYFHCYYQVMKRSSVYCEMRIKLEQLELRGDDCQTSIYIDGFSNRISIGRLTYPESQSVDVICNTDAGKEYVFETSHIDEVHLNVESSGGKSGKWKIKVTQVHCRDDDEVDVASEHSSHIPAVWHSHPTHPPKPPARTTTERPFICPWGICNPTATPRPTPANTPNTPRPNDPVHVGASSSFSRCGVKGPNQRRKRRDLKLWLPWITFKTNNNKTSDGESKPFIENTEWGFPPRNDSDHVEVLSKLKEKLASENPLSPQPTLYITHGKDAGPREYPWQVGMETYGIFLCDASIIGDQYILTAAHCVIRFKWSPESLDLILGDYDLSTSQEQTNYVPIVERVTVHPGYSRKTLRNDLAVLKLKSKIPFSESIRPICLAPAGFDPTGKTAIVTGWGYDQHNQLQSKLQELASKVTNNAYCGGQYEKHGVPSGFITEDMMCMSSVGGDSCNGDSGGPSVMQIGEIYYQVGIVSFGSRSCDVESLPGVYTRVTSYRDWIISEMN